MERVKTKNGSAKFIPFLLLLIFVLFISRNEKLLFETRIIIGIVFIALSSYCFFKHYSNKPLFRKKLITVCIAIFLTIVVLLLSFKV